MRCAVFLSHRNSVCLSTVRPTITISSTCGSPMILVFRDIKIIPKFEGVTLSEGVEWGCGGYELAIFDL